MSVARTVRAFKQFIRWIEAHEQAREILPSLRPPATAADIVAFEAKAKLKLPPALAAIYKLHNGQDERPVHRELGGPPEAGIFPNIESHSRPFLLVPLKHLKQNTPTTKRGWRMPDYRLKWIGFGDDYGGDTIVLDMAEETPPAKRGRILQFNHEYGGAIELAPSLADYFERLVRDVAAKRVKWSKHTGISYAKGKEWDDLIDAGKVEFPAGAAPEA